MKTLLIPLVAPLQSWGVRSLWNDRDTMSVPTKSGVIGLLANVLGRDREDPIDDLARLRFGVRVDRAGELLTDFQTVMQPKGRNNLVFEKQYLADAKFTAAVEGDDELIHSIQVAFMHPRGGPLFLGRRSCPPSHPVIPTVTDDPLEKALKDAPSLDAGTRTEDMPCEVETEDASSTIVIDNPVSFDRRKRSWKSRNVRRIASANMFSLAAFAAADDAEESRNG